MTLLNQRRFIVHTPSFRWTRLSAAAGLLAAGALVAAGPAPAEAPTAAAPAAVLTDYDTEIDSQFDSSRSVEHIRQLAEGIGPRLNGTPQERQGAEYIGGVLESYGFDVTYQSWGPVSTKRVAKVTSSDATLPGGPNWQLSASVNGRFTGDDAPVVGQVVDAGTGLTPADFPAGVNGAIALVDYSGNATTRSTIAANAVAAGASALIFAQTANNAAPPTITLTTPQPSIPVLGGGQAHGTWIRELLAKGPLTLRIASNEYVNPMGTNVIATRHAVGDPDGTTAPIVMVGAHIDSVLGAPGAHDDASGNGVSLEFARVLSQYPLDAELRIGGFGGEEGGLLGARAYVKTLTDAEKARFVGEWQMDMVGTPYAPAKLWALTPNGQSNYVVESAHDSVARQGLPDGTLQNCRLGQSDHQAFYDVGIPSSLFIWLDYRPPTPPAVCGPTGGSYQTEPQYHRPTDTMDNISPERLQTTLEVIGGAAAHEALNDIAVTTTPNAAVRLNCGDGWRAVGSADDAGRLDAVAPHATCTVEASAGPALVRETVTVHGDVAVDVPAVLPTCTTTVTGARSGPLTVARGVTCLNGAMISGPVTVRPGASLVSLGAVVSGPVTAQQAQDFVLCGGAVSGPVTSTGSTRVRIGGADGGCAGVKIAGPLTVKDTREFAIVERNTVSGPVRID
jgi:Zn-dependent M28 family amino/carboxypeptidase